MQDLGAYTGVAVLFGIIGGGINWLWVKLLEKRQAERKERKEDAEPVVAELRRQIDDLQQQLRQVRDTAEKESRASREKIDEMQTRIAYMEGMLDEGMPLAVTTLSLDGKVGLINRHFRDEILEPLGLTASELRGKKLRDVWPHLSSELDRLEHAAYTTKSRRAVMRDFSFGVEMPTLHTLKILPLQRGQNMLGFVLAAMSQDVVLTFQPPAIAGGS